MEQQPQNYQQYPPQQQVYAPAPDPVGQGEYNTQHKMEEDAKMALFMFIGGFFFCALWIVCMCKYKNSPSADAQKYARLSKIVFIITTIISVALVVFIVFFYIICFVFLVGVFEAIAEAMSNPDNYN